MDYVFLRIRVIIAIVFCCSFSIIPLYAAGEGLEQFLASIAVVTCLILYFICIKTYWFLIAITIALVGVFNGLQFTNTITVISFGFPNLYLMITFQQEALILFLVLTVLLLDSMFSGIRDIVAYINSIREINTNYFQDKFKSKSKNELADIIDSPSMSSDAKEAARSILKERRS